MTTRKRVLSIRLSDREYQSLKQQADAAGASVPLHARRLALDSIQIGPRLDQIERLLKGVPDRSGVIAAFEKLGARIAALAAKIDTATTKGAAP